MTYSILPGMSFGEAVSYYGKYIDAMKAKGKKPVSFLHFITGRF